jgi:hypothetical protein
VITFRVVSDERSDGRWHIECVPPGLRPFVWASFETPGEAEAELARLESERVALDRDPGG